MQFYWGTTDKVDFTSGFSRTDCVYSVKLIQHHGEHKAFEVSD